MGSTCSRNGKEGSSIEALWCGNMRGKVHIEDLGVDGRIVLKRFFRNRMES